jgi:hypothetical protein
VRATGAAPGRAIRLFRWRACSGTMSVKAGVVAITRLVPARRFLMTSTRSTASRALVTLLLSSLFLVTACGSGQRDASSGSPSASVTSDHGSPGPVMVVLGDSDATGAGDTTGGGWATRYADLVKERTGQEVDLRSYAEEGQTSQALLASLKSDSGLQDDVAAADFVVIGTGGGDLNLGDSAYLAHSCRPLECYTSALGGYAANIESVAGEIATLTRGRPVVLRAITLPYIVAGAEDVIPPELLDGAKKYGLMQATSLRYSTCAAMRHHGGACIDVLSAFNGPNGSQDAYKTGLLNHDDCCYPSSKGQQLMAELLIRSGTTPRPLR